MIRSPPREAEYTAHEAVNHAIARRDSPHAQSNGAIAMDYLYDKAPLVEVIAEIHWALKKLDTAPGAKIDPYYDLFKDAFLAYAKTTGLTDVQDLVPTVVPPELLPNQPRLRLRTAPGRWPLAQLGPGIITANIVPPYKGWPRSNRFFTKSSMVCSNTIHFPTRLFVSKSSTCVISTVLTNASALRGTPISPPKCWVSVCPFQTSS